MLYLNYKKVEFGEFPNGEIYLAKKNFTVFTRFSNIIHFQFEDNSDLIKLLMLKGFLDEQAVITNLNILYMPYSRMDRINKDYLFSLKYIANFINNMNFRFVYVVEPHSDVTLALLNNSSENHDQSMTIGLCELMIDNNEMENFVLMFPDAGAQKRYSDNARFAKSVVGFKKRDFQTGEIISFEVMSDIDLNGKEVIIIDDLCSKGGTFIASAKKLRELGASKVHLCVTHLENTSEQGSLFNTDLIDSVTATDSIYSGNEYDKLTIVEVMDWV